MPVTATAVPDGFPPEKVAEWFTDHVDHVFVVDDTLGPPPFERLDSAEKQSALVEDIENDADLNAWLVGQGVEVTEPLTKEVFRQLARLRSENESLERIWSVRVAPFAAVEDRDVVALLDILNQTFPERVTAVGPEEFDASAARKGRNIVFLDYLLEHIPNETLINDDTEPISDDLWERDMPEGGATAALGVPPKGEEKALEILTTLFDRPRPDDVDVTRPFVVLMSTARWAQRRERSFRHEAKVIRGLFRFSPKSRLADANQLHLELSGSVRNIPNAQKLQKFAEAVDAASNTAQIQLARRVLDFTVEDYAYCYELSLAPDGQPLGQYMVWLLSSYYDAKFERELGRSGNIAELDHARFEDMPGTAGGPSAAFVEAYEQASLIDVDDIVADVPPVKLEVQSAEAPTAPARKPQPEANRPVMVVLGDIFVAADVEYPDEAWMVVSPDCDLQWGMKRKFKPGRGVALIRGIVLPIHEPSGLRRDTAQTEFFRFNKKTFRIDWQLKEVRTVAYGSLRDFLETHNPTLRRVRRLRTPFALEVQQAYGADFTRVGLPVPPASFRPVLAKLQTRGAEGKAVTVLESVPAVHLAQTRNGAKLLFGTDFVTALYGQLDEISTHLLRRREDLASVAKFSERAENESEDGYLRRVHDIQEARDERSRIEAGTVRLDRLKGEFSRSIKLRGPHEWREFPRLATYLDGTLSVLFGDVSPVRYPADAPLLVFIQDQPNPVVAEPRPVPEPAPAAPVVNSRVDETREKL